MSGTRTLTGRIVAPDYRIPSWAQTMLHIAVWDRDVGAEEAILQASLSGPEGSFSIELSGEAALQLAMIGHRAGPQHIVSIGWGESLDPVMVNLPWPGNWSETDSLSPGWDGTLTVIGYVEQLHIEEFGGIPLAILEVAGRATPITYQRLPSLPVPVVGDRHGLDTDRALEDTGEQVYYLLADAETPLAALAQDALVSSLRIVATASLGPQEGHWHELVNLPLMLDKITLIGP
jgi:hypothetical protein